MVDIVEIDSEHIFLVDAKFFNEDKNEVIDAKIGMLTSDLKAYALRSEFTQIAQFYHTVCDGLILTRHIFEGLERPLYCDGKSNGDSVKLAYSRKPTKDCEWVGGKHGYLQKLDAPEGHVFAVIVSPNVHTEKYPDIKGWIEHWSWIKEDQGLNEAPINWVDRYNCKLWTWK